MRRVLLVALLAVAGVLPATARTGFETASVQKDEITFRFTTIRCKDRGFVTKIAIEYNDPEGYKLALATFRDFNSNGLCKVGMIEFNGDASSVNALRRQHETNAERLGTHGASYQGFDGRKMYYVYPPLVFGE